jgi:hypothetical protein
MSTINDRIDLFIAANKLVDTPEFRVALGDFVAGCWQDHFKICQNESIPDDKSSSKKVSKADKIEDPSECKERDDLRNCTSGTLNEFCKKHGLRVGGNKKEIMDRVWRHLQGNNSEEDISPRTKPKKEKKANEKHDCYGCTSKGTPCAVAATVEVDGCWFCWRHEESAQEIIANKKGSSSKVVTEEKEKKGSSKVVTKEKKGSKKVVTEEELETDDSDADTKKKVKVVPKGKKKEIIPVKEESDSESEEEVDEEQLETDEE